MESVAGHPCSACGPEVTFGTEAQRVAHDWQAHRRCESVGVEARPDGLYLRGERVVNFSEEAQMLKIVEGKGVREIPVPPEWKFPCRYEGCPGGSNVAQMGRDAHERRAHGRLHEAEEWKFPCRYEGCDGGSHKEQGRNVHESRKHGTVHTEAARSAAAAHERSVPEPQPQWPLVIPQGPSADALQEFVAEPEASEAPPAQDDAGSSPASGSGPGMPSDGLGHRPSEEAKPLPGNDRGVGDLAVTGSAETIGEPSAPRSALTPQERPDPELQAMAVAGRAIGALETTRSRRRAIEYLFRRFVWDVEQESGRGA